MKMGLKMNKRVLMEERGIEPRTFRKQSVMQLNIIRTPVFVKAVSMDGLQRTFYH